MMCGTLLSGGGGDDASVTSAASSSMFDSLSSSELCLRIVSGYMICCAFRLNSIFDLTIHCLRSYHFLHRLQLKRLVKYVDSGRL